MAKLQLTPLQLVEEVAQGEARRGLVIINLISNGVATSYALDPRAAMELASDLRCSHADAITQRGDSAEIIPFRRRA